MRVLAIDTSLRSSGVAIVESQGYSRKPIYYGVIKNPPKVPLSQALVEIRKQITALIDQYEPDCVAVEGVFAFKNIKTILILCHARGVAIEAATSKGLSVYEYPPTDIKKAITGSGRAEKIHVQQMVAKMLALSEIPQNDAADALAIALTHISRNSYVRPQDTPTL